MNWCFWLDYRKAAVPKAGSLQACVDSTGARDVSLELVNARVPSRFESWLYRALGLVLEPSEPIATLSALLTPVMAHVTFGAGEDDVSTVIAASDAPADGSVVSFTLPTGETRAVPRQLCIPRLGASTLRGLPSLRAAPPFGHLGPTEPRRSLTPACSGLAALATDARR